MASMPFHTCITSLPVYLLMDIGCFHSLAIVNRDAVNTGMPVSFPIIVLS